ncbi:MAG: cupin domain-containing protein [Elusimicrobiales bacterium]
MKKINIKKLVGYKKSSIVSNALIDKKAGNVTFFAFDKDSYISPHKAPYDAIVILIEGNIVVTLGKKEFKLDKNEMIIMPAGIIHSIKSLKKSKMILIMIKSNK